MDKNLLRQHFTLDAVPKWPCPTCSQGVLCLRKDDFRKEYNGATQSSRNHPAFDHDWVTYVYTGTLRCSGCGEKVVFCGTGGVEQNYDDSPRGWDYYDFFQPRFFHPAIRLIIIEHAASVPDNVLSSLDVACSLFWHDLDACANRIRTAVEYVMDDLAGERKKGETLHARIDALDSTKYGTIKTLLEAVKWIGNAGAHEMDGLHRESVIDGLEMLEHCLTILYPKPSTDATRLLELAKAINNAKAPVLSGTVRRASPSK